jgi:hypothetical protein
MSTEQRPRTYALFGHKTVLYIALENNFTVYAVQCWLFGEDSMEILQIILANPGANMNNVSWENVNI